MITNEQERDLELIAHRLTRRAQKQFTEENSVKHYDGIYQDILQELTNATNLISLVNTAKIKLAQDIKKRVLQRWDVRDLDRDQRNMLHSIIGTIDTFINTVTLD